MSDEIKVQAKNKKTKLIIAVAAVVIVVLTIVAIVLVSSGGATAKKIKEQLSFGDKYLSELQYEQAIAAYELAIEIDPKCEDAYLGLAEVYIATGEFDKAEEILDKAEEALGKETEGIKELREKLGGDNEGEGKLSNSNDEENLTLKPTATPAPLATATPIPTPTSRPSINVSGELVELTDAYVGSYVKFGSYEQDNDVANGQEDVEWLVLDIQDGNALLLSRYILDKKAYNDKWISWEESYIREWLNGEFYEQSFSDEEKEMISLRNVSAGYAVRTDDKVTLLESWETEEFFSSDESRRCIATKYAISRDRNPHDYYEVEEDGSCAWWKLASSYSDGVGIVDNDGDCHVNASYLTTKYVRPVVKINTGAYLEGNDAIEIGGSLFLGNYEQDNDLNNGKEKIEWIVLDLEANEALLISKYALDNMCYTNQHFTWENSTIREWLNTAFIGTAFTYKERLALQETKLENLPHPLCGIDGGNATVDKVFLNSIDEVEKYFPMDRGAKNKLRMAETTAYARDKRADERWILRSPGQITHSASMVSDNDGMIYGVYDVNSGISSSGGYCIYSNEEGIRPAMWINIEDAVAAKESEPSEIVFSDTIVGLNEAGIGSCVYYGAYEQDNNSQNGQEKIEWFVLDVAGEKALLLSRFALDVKVFQDKSENGQTWEESSLRVWLNDTFYSTAFSDNERQNIITTQVITSDYFGTYPNGGYVRNDGGDVTWDNVFLLSEGEASLYFPMDIDYENVGRATKPTEYAIAQGARVDAYGEWSDGNCKWWLRSTARDRGTMSIITGDGGFYDEDTFRECTVRPAIWVNLKQ